MRDSPLASKSKSKSNAKLALPPFDGIEDYPVTDMDDMPTDPVFVQLFRRFPDEVLEELGLQSWRSMHEYTSEPIKVGEMRLCRQGTKSEYFINFMSWWNAKEGRWERIPAGYYPEGFQFSFSNTKRIWEMWLKGHHALHRLRGEDGELPPDSAYMAVPESIPEPDAEPDVLAINLCRPPPSSASTAARRSQASSRRQKAIASASVPTRPVRSNRSVLPSRYGDFQHVDTPSKDDRQADERKRKRYGSDDERDKQATKRSRAARHGRSSPIPNPGTPPVEDDDDRRPIPPPPSQP